MDKEYWMEEAQRQESRANLEEKRKGFWQLNTFLLGGLIVMQVYSWCISSRPATWEIDYDKPVVTEVYFQNWWSGAERTKYAWGKAEDGTEGWLPLGANGQPIPDSDEMLRAKD